MLPASRRVSRVESSRNALDLNAQETSGADTWPLRPERLNWGRLPTAGSCMRGFRTPDGTRNPSPKRSKCSIKNPDRRRSYIYIRSEKASRGVASTTAVVAVLLIDRRKSHNGLWSAFEGSTPVLPA
jgi:hypothetical protein